jgi:hypothetical protein
VDPTALFLIGTYPVNGDFPNAIAVKEDLLCVTYAGARSGVSCAEWGPLGIGRFDSLRAFNLHQQNPPNTTLLLVSDAIFVENNSLLVVPVRGSAGAPGFVATFSIGRNGKVSDKASDAIPTGVTSSFGAAAVPQSSLILVAEPSFGAYTLDLNHPQAPASKFTVPGQAAICWTAMTGATTGILPDAGTNVLTEVDVRSGKIVQQWKSTNGNSGNFDFIVSADDIFYSLAFNPSDGQARIASINLSGKFADIDNVAIAGTDNHSQGLAIYPAA